MKRLPPVCCCCFFTICVLLNFVWFNLFFPTPSSIEENAHRQSAFYVFFLSCFSTNVRVVCLFFVLQFFRVASFFFSFSVMKMCLSVCVWHASYECHHSPSGKIQSHQSNILFLFLCSPFRTPITVFFHEQMHTYVVQQQYLILFFHYLDIRNLLEGQSESMCPLSEYTIHESNKSSTQESTRRITHSSTHKHTQIYTHVQVMPLRGCG